MLCCEPGCNDEKSESVTASVALRPTSFRGGVGGEAAKLSLAT